MSQNTTQYGTIEQCNPNISKQQKKSQKTQKNGELGPGEGVLELLITGEFRNRITPLRKSGIQ